MAPLRTDNADRELAYKRARSYLASEYSLEPDSTTEYLHALTPDGDLEMKFLPDEPPIVTFRLLSRTPTPMRPLCVTRGCVNGNQEQRARVTAVRDALGWRSDDSSYENERFDGWVPIFLH